MLVKLGKMFNSDLVLHSNVGNQVNTLSDTDQVNASQTVNK